MKNYYLNLGQILVIKQIVQLMTSAGFNVFKPDVLKDEILLLWAHWKCLTAETQTFLAHVLKKLLKDFHSKFDQDTIKVLQELTEDLDQTEPFVRNQITSNTCFVFFNMLKIKQLKEFSKKFAPQKKEDLLVKTKQDDQNIKRTRKFEPLNTLLPSLKHYSLMSRCYSDRLPYDEEPEESQFYRNPRLFKRAQELWEAQGKSFTSPNKGVLLLTVQGTHIVAGRGMLVTNGNCIQWWLRKTSKDSRPTFRGIIGQDQIVVDQDGKEVQKQKQKDKATRPQNMPSELQLDFKFVGHQGNVTAISLSYDQFFFISAATDKVIKLWCLRTKILLLNFKSHSNIIWSINFSDSGYYFLSSSADKSVRLWKTDTPAPIRVMLEHKSDVYKAQFMKNPDYVISCSADKTLRIWAVKNGQCIRKIHFQKELMGFTQSFSGRYCVTNQINGNMTMIDFARGEQINTFNLFFLKKSREQTSQTQKQRYPIHCMAFSPDQQKFVCISKKQIAIYSMQSLKQKISTDIYQEMKGETLRSKKQGYIKPKEILDIGGQMNLLYCRFSSKDYLLVAGRK